MNIFGPGGLGIDPRMLAIFSQTNLEHLFMKLAALVFYYPLLMAFVWMIGALVFYLRWEAGKPDVFDGLPELSRTPSVSILIPCHNEGYNIRDTVAFAAAQDYPNFDIIAINDGSTDNTLELLRELTLQYPQLQVLNLATNQGKAMGLRTAALLSKAEILIGIDGDSLLAPEATAWMVRHFLDNPAVGVVTGNPRVRNRTTLLGRIQVGEFSAIVGLIKRAQQAYGRIFTVSGVIAAFRKSALHEVDYWSTDMVTEDIDISWKLQLAGWEIAFEPNAMCWVLMPETVRGLWKQRARWAQGGAEAMLRYAPEIMRWRSRRLWPLFMEYWVSVIWSFLLVATAVLAIIHSIDPDQRNMLLNLMPRWTTILLSLTCLLQFGFSLFIDSRYEARQGGMGKYYFWIVWYPLAYWMIGVTTSIAGVIRALRKKRGVRAVWVTNDRGLRPL